MNQTITISEPGIPKVPTFFSWLLSTIFLFVIGSLALIIAFLPSAEEDLVKSISMALFGGLMYVALISGLINYPKLRKRTVTFDMNGITIQNINYQAQIPWDEVSTLSLTYVFLKAEADQFHAYPYMLAKLSPNISVPTLPIQHTSKGIPLLFVANKSDFANYQGNTEDYTIAINVEHFPDKDVTALFANTFKKELRASRPIIQVDSAERYNELVQKNYAPEKASAYMLPIN